MNRRIRFTLLLVLLLGLTAMSAVKAQDTSKAFRVAVVAPSAKNDLAFSESMYDALVAIQNDMGQDKFQFDFTDNTFDVDQAASAIRDWASSGKYNLIIAHGSQFGSDIQEIAPDFPDISFAWGTDVNTFDLPNVYAYTAAAEEGGYINGAIAASMTKSKVIGVVGPIEVGDAKQYIDGFKVGVAATDPSVTVNVTYTGDFSNVSLSTEAAKALVANGADILTGSSQMVVGPIAVAQQNKGLWFGTQSSQADLAADAGVTFEIYRWDVILKDMISDIQSGTLGGKAYTLTLKNGGLEMQISDKNTTLTDDQKKTIQATIDDLTAKISSGDIVVLPEATPEATAETTMEATMEATPEATP